MVTKRSLRNKKNIDSDEDDTLDSKLKNNNSTSTSSSSKKDKKQSKKEEKKNKKQTKQTNSSTVESKDEDRDSNSEAEEPEPQVSEEKFQIKSKQTRIVSELSKGVKINAREQDISSTLATVRFLRANGDKALEKLVTNYHLKVKKHSHFSNLFSLKYDMLKSPFSTDVVQECRGLVLDRDNNYKVVCYPFKKFFNYGEKYNASKDINWKETRVYEKIDGSLCTLYYYGEMWWISTTGTASGNGYLHSKNKTFDQLFWGVWKRLGYQLPDPTTNNKVYMFELFSNEHSIIVKPDRDRIVLLGVRDLSTLREEDPQPTAQQMKWECAESYPMYTSVGMVFDAARNLDPSQHEGFVVCDSNFNRIKIKSPQYVALAHLVNKDNDEQDQTGADSQNAEQVDSVAAIQSRRRKMLQIVRNNESSEFLAYYPNLEEIHTSVKLQYDKLLLVSKEIAQDIKNRYYSNGEEESSNKDAIVNFIQRKCQNDYTKLLESILAVDLPFQNPSNSKVVIDEEEMKSNKKISKIIKQTLTIAVYQEMFGNKTCEQVYSTVEISTLFDLLNFASFL